MDRLMTNDDADQTEKTETKKIKSIVYLFYLDLYVYLKIAMSTFTKSNKKLVISNESQIKSISL